MEVQRKMDGFVPNPNHTPHTMEELYRYALDHFPGSVIIIDSGGNILYANDMSAHMLGVTKEWLLSSNMHTVVQSGLARESAGLNALEQNREIMYYIPNYRDEGMLVSSFPMRESNDQISAVFTYSHDEQFLKKYIAWADAEKTKLSSALQIISEGKYSSVIAENCDMQRLLRLAEHVAPSSATVTLYGESGVGKEVIAQYIHQKSKRSNQIFLPINCSAIPESLAESEFFGYEKGAFTGANQTGKLGFFEIANRGTLFLDEVGELSLALQAKLLRVLESGEFSRVGGDAVIHSDTRIICATNRDLKQMVADGTFREDLYYRLNVLPLHIPPLRERKEDILPLATHFLQEMNHRNGYNKVFSPEAARSMREYSWPGNVRELRNIVERMAIITEGDIISAGSYFLTPASGTDHNNGLTVEIGTPLKEAMREMERQYLEKCLEKCDGKVSQLSKMLQAHPSGLYRKLADYQISFM